MIMPSRLRKFALAAHITLAVGWIDAVAGYIALDVAAATSQNAQTLRAAYLAMESIAWYVIVPLTLASLLTGLVMSLGTKWGLFRHYWVLISYGIRLYTSEHERETGSGRIGVLAVGGSLPQGHRSGAAYPLADGLAHVGG